MKVRQSNVPAVVVRRISHSERSDEFIMMCAADIRRYPRREGLEWAEDMRLRLAEYVEDHLHGYDRRPWIGYPLPNGDWVFVELPL